MHKKIGVISSAALIAILMFALQWFFNTSTVQQLEAVDGILDLRGQEVPNAFLIGGGWKIYDGAVYPERLTGLTPRTGPMRLYGRSKTYMLEILVDEICPLAMLDSSRYVSGISVGKPYIYSAYVRPGALVSLTGESAVSNLWRKLPDGFSFEIVLQTDFSDPAKEYLDPLLFGEESALQDISNYHIILGAVPLGALLVILATSLALYTRRPSESYLLLMALEAFFALLWCVCKFMPLPLSNRVYLALERIAYAGTLAGVFLLCSNLYGRGLRLGEKIWLILGGLSALLALLPPSLFENLPRIHLWLCEPMLQASLALVVNACWKGDRRAILLLWGVITFDVVHLYALLADVCVVPANVGNLFLDPMLLAILLMTLAMMLYTSRVFSHAHNLASELNRELGWLNENLEKRIAEKTSDLADALDRLVEEQNRNNELMTNIFHNLRSPLFAIRGYSDILLKNTEGEAQSVLKRVRSNADYLCRMSEDLFLCARLQEHRVELNILTVDVTELIHQMTGGLSILAQQRGVQLQCLHAGPVYADCDPFHIQTVLRNLLENAIRFSPVGGVVAVTAEQCEACASIRVRDYGEGVEDAERIFERYYKSPGRKQNTRSTGLGLYLSRSLAELHGGRLYARNASPGAEFILELPPSDLRAAAAHTGPH